MALNTFKCNCVTPLCFKVLITTRSLQEFTHFTRWMPDSVKHLSVYSLIDKPSDFGCESNYMLLSSAYTVILLVIISRKAGGHLVLSDGHRSVVRYGVRSFRLGCQTVSDFTLYQWFPNAHTATKENLFYMYFVVLFTVYALHANEKEHSSRAVALLILYNCLDKILCTR